MENLLEVKNLTFSFHTYGGVVKAVRDVSFEVRPGEILGIVGGIPPHWSFSCSRWS